MAAEDQLAEVIVTAEKVAENIRDVPVSESVISGADLQNMHIADLEDITRIAPNLSFSSNGNPGGSTLEMRGISSQAGASTIGMYLDDVPITARMLPGSITQAAQPEPQLFDVQQVEVLRGPQGTLYGASAEGGVIKFRMNAVNLTEFSGFGLAESSGTESGTQPNYKVTGVVNMPVSQGVAGLRLAAQTIYDSGYIDRYSPDTGALVAKGINDDRKDAARLAFRARPIDGLTLDASLFYQHITYGSSDTITLALDHLSTNSQVPDSGSDTLIIPSLTVQYERDWGSVVSVTSDYQRSIPFTYDGTVFNSGYIGDCLLDGLCGAPPVADLHGNLSGSRIADLPSPGLDTEYIHQFTEELRVSSTPYQPGGAPLTWVAGIFYLTSRDGRTDNEIIPGFNSVFTSLYGTEALSSIFGGPFPGGSTFASSLHYTEKQYAAFADVTFHPTSSLRVSAGARYMEAHQNEAATETGFFVGGQTSYSVPTAAHPITPRVSVVYQLNEGVSTYATASRGFRLGGPNSPIPTEFCGTDLAALGYKTAPGSYAPDDLWNYEFGVKARPSRQFEVNASFFYDRWSQLQQQFVLPTCGFSFSTNVGSARSYGSELELRAIPIQGLTFGLSLGYTHATLTETIPEIGVRAGDPLEYSPEWSGTASVEYSLPLSASMTGYVRGNYDYVGSSHGSLVSTDPDYNRPAYGLMGASLGLRINTVNIAVFARNLLNNDTVIQTPDHATVPVGVVLRPRTLGLSVSADF